jgi:ABC-type nitrate/sulfonate/bicarbonate transport system substrate-binding protein
MKTELKTMKKFAILLAAAFLFSPTAYAQEEGAQIVFGVETSFLTAPVWIAEREGYFVAEGVDVKIKEFSSGRNALAAMFKEGELDMVTVAQTPVMFNSFERNDYVVIAAMVTSDNDVKVLARGGSGIARPRDLAGKTIGITKGSTGHYFLAAYLTYHGFGILDVTTVDLNAPDLPQALADGRVDAISVWEPHILNAQKQLGDQAILLPNERDIFREDFYFVSRKTFTKTHPETLKRFLKAIEKAQTFIHEYRESAITIVAERLKIDRELVLSVWDDFEFRLMLDQSILITLESEAKWAINNKFTDRTEVPNYLDYLYEEALKDVKPKAVTIIR